MIRKLKRNKKNSLSTLDIETAKNGNLLSLCIYNGEKCVHFSEWREFFYFLEINNHDKRYHKFVAHNGGKFDWVSFIEGCLDLFKDVEIIIQGSQIVFIKISDFKNNIVLQDSLLVLKKSLKDLCDTFKVERPKQDIDINRIEEIFHNDYDTYKNYLEHDVISLYEVIEKAETVFDIDFWPVTIASLSMWTFRKQFLEHNIFKNKLKNDTDEFFTESYAGGRVECFKAGYYEKVYVYDINSLYPSVMSNADIPICLPIKTYQYYYKSCGFYKVEFNQTNRQYPPVLWEKTKNGLEFVYKGIGTFYYKELNLLRRMGGSFKVIEGYIYPKTAKVFKKFVDYFYGKRMDYQGTSMDFCFKILLNSLYGKFAQKCKTTKLVKWDEETFNQNKDSVIWQPYLEDKGLYEITEERRVYHRAVYVSSIVTALARISLYHYLALSPSNLIYCDTDSYHTLLPLDNRFIDKKRLGAMKLEVNGEPGVYIGRKQYAVGNKMKFKGIPIKSKLPHDNITFEDYIKLLKGEQRKFNYTSFPALKSVIKGKKACAITKYYRNIKKADYNTNFKR